MKFICQFHLFLMLFICCFSCVNHSRQFAESDAKICQNNKVADEYIVHWKNLKPTLVHTLDAQKYIKIFTQRYQDREYFILVRRIQSIYNFK